MKSKIPLASGEEVLRSIGSHWLKITAELVALFFVFLIPFFLLWPLFRLGPIGAAAFSAAVLATLSIAFREYSRWRGTVLVVTNRRLVHVEQRGVLDQAVTEVSYPMITDVSYRIHGLVSTLVNVGTLTVQSRGTTFTVHYIERPSALHQLILDLKQEDRDQFAFNVAQHQTTRSVEPLLSRERMTPDKLKSSSDDDLRSLFAPDKEP